MRGGGPRSGLETPRFRAETQCDGLILLAPRSDFEPGPWLSLGK